MENEPSAQTGNIVLWHGSQGWDGPPSIPLSRKGRHEHGPGIYATTSLATASKYAKGGGSIVRLEIDPSVRWLENLRLPSSVMIDFVESLSGLRQKSDVLADLRYSCERHPDGMAFASYMVNLLVNHEAMLPRHGPLVAEFLSAAGADASLAKNSMDEQWVVILNPGIVRRWRRVPKSSIPADEWDLPLIRTNGGKPRPSP